MSLWFCIFFFSFFLLFQDYFYRYKCIYVSAYVFNCEILFFYFRFFSYKITANRSFIVSLLMLKSITIFTSEREGSLLFIYNSKNKLSRLQWNHSPKTNQLDPTCEWVCTCLMIESHASFCMSTVELSIFVCDAKLCVCVFVLQFVNVYIPFAKIENHKIRCGLCQNGFMHCVNHSIS